jgi:hypothetical protein
VKWINADKLWELGFTGQNIVVGGADTGIQFDHPALNKLSWLLQPKIKSATFHNILTFF